MRRKITPVASNVKRIVERSETPSSEPVLIRCAAYCRVSLIHGDVDGSIESQTRYFTNLINSTPGWTMAGIYVDNGRSGLQSYNRPGFLRMMRHCQEGRIDKILTKSVSRISRSSSDFLDTVGRLKDLGIGIYFEREGFDTQSIESDFLLSTFSAIAQEESRSMSQNVRWGHERRFSNGIPMLRRVLGYDIINRKTHVEVKIIEPEAGIVREIFDLAVSGLSLSDIARRMIAKGEKTAAGNSVWSCHTIKCILQNHIYTGSPMNRYYGNRHFLDRIKQKTKGESAKYLFENHHEAIVSQEQFDRVQQILGKYQSKPVNTWVRYPLSGRITCGECGGIFYFHQHGNRNQFKYWNCSQRRISTDLCQIGTIREKDLEAAMKMAFFQRYTLDKSLSLKRLRSDLERINEHSSFEHARLILQTNLDSAIDREQQSEGQDGEAMSIRLEAELKASELFWDQLESDRKYRDQALTWLKSLSPINNSMDAIREKITIELMRAWIMRVTVYKSGLYSFDWFDKMITNIRTNRELNLIEKPASRRQENISTKEISVAYHPIPSNTVRVKAKRVMPLRLPPIPGVPKSRSEPGLRRVAAYCRVSSADHSQQSSYELQIAHYTQLIRNNPDWQFAGIYADEASGTNIKKRPNFLRMIEDAKRGEIDLIITKSISRFSRSVVDFLTYTRLLKDLNPPVDVYLERENLYTLSAQSELILTLLSALAQEESFANSENAKWGIEKRFSFGIVPKTKLSYGYDADDNGNWFINEEEATVVRRIYAEYVAGQSTLSITRGLNRDKIRRRDGQTTWRPDSVADLLHSEVYTGDLLLNQQFTVDYLSHQRKRNRGEYAQYHLENHHPAIIDKADWERTKAIMAQRAEKHKLGKTKTIDPDKRKRFFRMFTCCRCGQAFVLIRRTDGGYVLSCSSNRYRGVASPCHIPSLAVENIEHAFGVMLLEMKREKARLQAEASAAIERYRVTDIQVQRTAELTHQIDGLLEKLSQESFFVQTTDDADDHIDRISNLSLEIEKNQVELKQIQDQKSAEVSMKEDLAWLLEMLDSIQAFDPNQEISEFREEIFNRLVKRGEMQEDFRIRLGLSIGIEWILQCKESRAWIGFKQRMTKKMTAQISSEVAPAAE